MKHYDIASLLILVLWSIEISKGSCFPNIFMFSHNPMLLIGKLVGKPVSPAHAVLCVKDIHP